MTLLDQPVDPGIVGVLYYTMLFFLCFVMCDIIETIGRHPDLPLCKKCGKHTSAFRITHHFICSKKKDQVKNIPNGIV